MEKSESIKELASALAKAQGMITGAKKDSANPFFKTTYADLSSVVESIRTALSENGLSYVQKFHASEKDEVRIETVILHSSGEWLSCGILNLPASKHDAQGFGSAATYARRYSLSAAFGVAPEDDDGNAATKQAPKAIKPPTGGFDAALATIHEASNMDTLKEAFLKATKAFKDKDSVDRLTAAKDDRKIFLTQEPKE